MPNGWAGNFILRRRTWWMPPGKPAARRQKSSSSTDGDGNMEARSKSIEQWFSAIEQGQIKLPRFQRHEAWRPQQIAGLFENILRAPSLPIGVLLILEVG